MNVRVTIFLLLLICGCQSQPSVQSETPATPDEKDIPDVRSAASGDDVDPSYFSQLPILTLPWSITMETFGCNAFDSPTELGILGDTSLYYLLVSVRTLSPGTQQLRFTTYEKDGTWVSDHNRLEFCVALVDTDQSFDDDGDCPLKLVTDYDITVMEDLRIKYSETQVRSHCEAWTKDSFTGAGEIVDGVVSGFSIKSKTETSSDNN